MEPPKSYKHVREVHPTKLPITKFFKKPPHQSRKKQERRELTPNLVLNQPSQPRITKLTTHIVLEESSPSEDQYTVIENRTRASQKKPWCQTSSLGNLY